MKREIIGFVIRGGYSQLRGKAVGLGMVDSFKLKELR